MRDEHFIKISKNFVFDSCECEVCAVLCKVCLNLS